MARAKATPRLTSTEVEAALDLTESLHVTPVGLSERERDLRDFSPRAGHSLPSSILDVLYAMVLNVPFRTSDRDRSLLAVMISNATYYFNIHGDYDPAKATSEPGLARWKKEELSRRAISPRSQGDYCSIIRTVAKNNGLAPHLLDRAPSPRGTSGSPAAAAEWRRVEDRAKALPTPLRTDVTMLADLTFGIGMRASEAGRARREDLVLLRGGEGRMDVFNDRGECRGVPVGPNVVQRILAANRPRGAFLVRPDCKRHNLSHSLFKVAEGHRSDIKFDLAAARNRYIVNLLGQPLPFSVVCYLADLAPGGHTAQDLAKYAITPDEKRIFEFVRETWR